MGIHQMQLRYEPVADRLLLSVRTHEAELYTVWLTRRMTARLHGPLTQTVARLGLSKTSPGAVAVPEAQEMLVQAARERPLPGTDFNKPFAQEGVRKPLGPDPLLPAHIELKTSAEGQLLLAVSEDQGRRINLNLGDNLATALLRLLEQALKAADWGLTAAPAPAAVAPPPQLN